MAQFRGTIKGQKGEESRLGSKPSGFCATVDGWNAGIYVEARWDERLGMDVFRVYETGGSNGRGGSRLIFELRDIPGNSELERAARVLIHHFGEDE